MSLDWLFGVILGVLGGLAGSFIGALAIYRLRRRIFSAILTEIGLFLSDFQRFPEAYTDITAPILAGAKMAAIQLVKDKEVRNFAKDSVFQLLNDEEFMQGIEDEAANAIGIAMSRLAEDVKRNPDKYADILKPMLTKAARGAAEGAMPRFKWQDMIGMLAMRFMGNLEKEAPRVAEEAVKKAGFLE